VAFWYPHVAATFGHAESGRFETLRKLGLRHRMNEILMVEWQQEARRVLSGLGIAI
jgi:1,2-phenylacetyl-CoA epoxidase catalytic subunit